MRKNIDLYVLASITFIAFCATMPPLMTLFGVGAVGTTLILRHIEEK